MIVHVCLVIISFPFTRSLICEGPARFNQKRTTPLRTLLSMKALPPSPLHLMRMAHYFQTTHPSTQLQPAFCSAGISSFSSPAPSPHTPLILLFMTLPCFIAVFQSWVLNP